MKDNKEIAEQIFEVIMPGLSKSIDGFADSKDMEIVNGRTSMIEYRRQQIEKIRLVLEKNT